MAGVIFDTRALQAVVDANTRAPAELRKVMNAAGRQILIPAWKDELNQRGRGVQRQVIHPGAYARAGFTGFTLVAGSGRKQLSGGGKPSELARPYEFGATRTHTTSYVGKSPTGTKYLVHKRHTQNQLPPRARKGYVAYPAGAAVLKRAVNLWIEIAVKVLADAMEGK